MKAPLLNPLLTGIGSRFLAGLPNVGARIAPLFNTAEQSAKYYIYDRANLTNIPTNINRSPASGFARVKSTLSDDNFFCDDYGVEEPIDNAEIKLYGSVFNAERSAMERAIRIVAINHELRVRNLARAATLTASPSVKWNAASSTTIIADVKAAKAAIREEIGVEPNVMVLPYDVHSALEIAPELLERFKYTEGGTVTLNQMKMLFGVQDIIVSGDLINTAAEGLSESIDGIWTDEAFLCYANPSQDLKALTWARTFNWTAMGGSGPAGISVYTYDDNPVDSRIVRARQFTDEKVSASGAAYYFSNVLA